MRLNFVLILFMFLSGCISLPNGSISPNPQFYILSAIHKSPMSKEMNVAVGEIIGIGPVEIPDYLNRPQMVTRDKTGILKFDEFNRWGESLDLGLERVIREDLTLILAKDKIVLYPWGSSMSVKYQVLIEIVQLDSELDGNLHELVQWTIMDVLHSKTMMVKRSEFRKVILPKSSTGLVNALNATSALLSAQIAQALVHLK